jgi:SAM-dependent methyltransferase
VDRPEFERRFAEENYRDDAPLSARQSIWAYAGPMTPPLDYVDFTGAKTIVDVGCGNGVWLERVRRHPEVSHATVVGLDLSAGMLDALRSRIGPTPLLQADAVRLPMASASVDVAMALWMLYHVSDLPAALRELHRVLREGGTLLAVTVGASHLHELVALLNDALRCCVGPVEPEDWWPESHFTAEDAPADLGAVFGDVEAHVVHRPVRIPTATPILDYLTSLRDSIEIAIGRELPWREVLKAAEHRIGEVLAVEDHFVVTGVVATFVCHA